MTRSILRKDVHWNPGPLATAAVRAVVVATMVTGAALGAAAPAFAAEVAVSAAAGQSDDTGEGTDGDGDTSGSAGPSTGSSESAGSVGPSKEDSMGVQSLKTVRFRLTNASYHPLTVIDTGRSDRSGERWRSGEQPQAGDVLVSPAIADYNMENPIVSSDIDGWVRYRIGDTGYRLKIQAANPGIGSNTASCSITDSAGKSVDSSISGLTCDKKAGAGIDMNADFVIQPTSSGSQVLTDYTDITRRDALEGMCGKDQPTFSACDASVINTSYKRGKPTIASSVLVNCTNSEAQQVLEASETVGVSTSVGTSVDVTLNLGDKLSVGMTKEWTKTWERSVTNTNSTWLTAQPHEYGYIETQVRMAEITGDYTIKAGNQTFEITNVTLHAPGTADAPVDNVEVPLVANTPRAFDLDDDACAEANNQVSLKKKPTSVTSGATYTMSLRGANALQISDPGSTRANDTRLTLGQRANGRNQNWVFTPVAGSDYFQIRSDLTPRLCLDVLWGTEGSDVVQHYCKEASDASIGNQLWQAVYDPITDAYKIVQPHTGKVLAVSDAKQGAALSVMSETDAKFGRWELFKVG